MDGERGPAIGLHSRAGNEIDINPPDRLPPFGPTFGLHVTRVSGCADWDKGKEAGKESVAPWGRRVNERPAVVDYGRPSRSCVEIVSNITRG